jgi:hypothetical protein
MRSRVGTAHDGVELGEGVSLHQARAMDDYRSDAEVAAARALDTESRWQDVTDEKLERLSDTLPFMDAKPSERPGGAERAPAGGQKGVQARI